MSKKDEFYEGANEQVSKYLKRYKLDDQLIKQTKYVKNRKFLLSDMMMDFANDEFERRNNESMICKQCQEVSCDCTELKTPFSIVLKHPDNVEREKNNSERIKALEDKVSTLMGQVYS